MQRNVKAFMDALKKDIAQMSDRISKEIHEVVSHGPLMQFKNATLTVYQVLSSTNSPGFTLSGEFRGPNSIPARELAGPL
jgi:large subunit ribosomal protein L1